MNFKAVISNPPYSIKWSASDKFKEDKRFRGFTLAPKGKADYAFILNGLSHLEENGTAAFILPHGVLFRAQTEEKIRRKLIELNWLDGVIGLPGKLFDITDIPIAVMVFKKNKTNKDIMFVDASKEFEKGKNQNFLNDKHLKKIFEAYQNRKDIEKYAHLASLEEVQNNGFNLNIPRYVDTFEEEPPIDVFKVVKEYRQTDDEVEQLKKEIGGMFSELVGTTPEAQAELDEMKRIFNAGTKD